MEREDIDEGVAWKTHLKGLEIWKQLDGMPHYEIGGLMVMLLAMYVASYPKRQRGSIYDRVGDLAFKMVGEITHEVLKRNGPDGGDWKMQYSDQASDAMLKDPELRAAVNDMTSRIMQALEGLDMTDRAAVEAAMNALGAERVESEDIEDMIETQPLPKRPN